MNAAVKLEYDTVKDLLNIEFLVDVPIYDSVDLSVYGEWI
jgi:hypothetical protein